MPKQHLKLVPPAIEKRTVTPGRQPNSAYRTREHLTEAEIERLIGAVKDNRYGHRDATMVLVAYRHGLRVSELVDLRWTQVDFAVLVHEMVHHMQNLSGIRYECQQQREKLAYAAQDKFLRLFSRDLHNSALFFTSKG